MAVNTMTFNLLVTEKGGNNETHTRGITRTS